MRILLVAYDYPPLSSPQAIRWYYLTRELVRLGAEVHVLCPELAIRDEIGLIAPPGIVMHRCYAGGLAGWLARRAQTRVTLGASRRFHPADGAQTDVVTLNWKGRLHHLLDRCISRWVYPDSRGQWRRPASTTLDKLINTVRPDVLITSHEPAVTLQLGLQVAARVPAWLADLGDPVLAAYTPKRWHRRATALEADVCRVATAISVTTAKTRELLLGRYALDPTKVFVLSQGFDDTLPARSTPSRNEDGQGCIHLLYTGRFYSFRDPTALFEAVAALEQVRLTVAAPDVKPGFLAYTAQSNGRIVFLGEQPHARVLELQQRCDLLVNIGNAQVAQTPGKLFEYLGSGKPILHCYYADDDPVNALIATWHRGWSCRNDRRSLQILLDELVRSPEKLQEASLGDASATASYGWSRLARDLLDRCINLHVNVPS